MPEGDTIERIARRLAAPRRDRPGHRHAASAEPPLCDLGERLAGQALQRIEARGKHLLMTFESGLVVHVHLRMTGRFKIAPAGTPILVPHTRSGWSWPAAASTACSSTARSSSC